jgi:thioesterase domain-containing protein
MSRYARAVAEAVIAMGEATLDALKGVLPVCMSRRDLEKAVAAANAEGWIRVARKAKPTVWKAGHVPLVKPPKVASVFELGSPRAEGEWPKPWMGTVHRPLGGWNSEESTA